jgi:hypothetical protein
MRIEGKQLYVVGTRVSKNDHVENNHLHVNAALKGNCLSSLTSFYFKRPGNEKFCHQFPLFIGASRGNSHGLTFFGRNRFADRIVEEFAILAKETGPPVRLFEVIYFHFNYQHGYGRVLLINPRHGQGAGTHLGSHAETGKVGRPEGVFRKPLIGHRYQAALLIQILDPDTGKVGTWKFCKQKHPEPDRVKGQLQKGVLLAGHS